MKARRKGTNEPFKEIELVTFVGSTYVDELCNIPVKYLEFEQQQEPNNTPDHWQDIRERAAIAAMQGLLAHSGDAYTESFIARQALIYADALIEKLKGNKSYEN